MKKRLLLNSYNTTGMGPAQVSRALVENWPEELSDVSATIILPKVQEFSALVSKTGLRVVLLPSASGLFKLPVRLLFEIGFWIYLKCRAPEAVVILANYTLGRGSGRQVLFMRHPYLVDRSTEGLLGTKRRLLESCRRAVFRWSLGASDVLVVQSEAMKASIKELYAALKCPVKVLPNPTFLHSGAEDVLKAKKWPDSVKFPLLYVSRYYGHKNHEYIASIAELYEHELQRQSICFVLTVEPDQLKSESRELAQRLETLEGKGVVINLGELSKAEIASCYQLASALFYPSFSETFGNSIVEAMNFGLPILIADRPYSRVLCNAAANYFDPSDYSSGYAAISTFCSDPSLNKSMSIRSREQARHFPSVEEWIDSLLKFCFPSQEATS